MGETEKAKKDSALKDQTSDDKKESTSTQPQTYTKEERNKAVSDALAEQGRVHKAELEPLKQERDTFKTQAEQAQRDAEEATETLKESREHASNLESDIETLEEDDEDPNKLSRLRRELRDAKINVRQEVKAEKDAATEERRLAREEREANAELVADAQTFKFDGELAKLVDDYDGDVTANFTKLKTACDKAGVKAKEGAEAIADLYMTKKAEEPEILDDLGVTSGGGSGIPTTKSGLAAWVNSLSQDEYEKRAPEINKMRREGKIK